MLKILVAGIALLMMIFGAIYFAGQNNLQKSTAESVVSPAPQSSGQAVTSTATSTAHWKTYRSNQGYEIQYPNNWSELTCLDGVQFFLYEKKDLVEDCWEYRGLTNDLDIIPSRSGNVDDASTVFPVRINGIDGMKYVHVPVGQDRETPFKYINSVVLTKDDKTFEIGLPTDSSTTEQILSTFKFIQ